MTVKIPSHLSKRRMLDSPLTWLIVALLIAAVASQVAAFMLKHVVDRTPTSPLDLPVVVVWKTEVGSWILLLTAVLAGILITVPSLFIMRGLYSTKRNALVWLVGSQFAISLGLSFLPITLSMDPYSYLIYGRLFSIHHVIPYGHLTIPRTMSDPLLEFLSHHFRVGIPDNPYGPLWTLIAGALAQLERNSSLWMQFWSYRLLEIIAAACAALGLFHILRTLPMRERCHRVAIFALHPLVLFETAVGAHNDMVMVALTIWAFALVEELPALAALLFAASVAVKYMSLIAAPFFLIKAARHNIGRGIIVTAIAFAAGVLAFIPFRSSHSSVLKTLLGAQISVSPTALIDHILKLIGLNSQSALNGFGLPHHHVSWIRMIQVLMIAGFFGVVIFSYAQYIRNSFSSCLWRTISATVWVLPTVLPWYCLWLCPSLIDKNRWGAFAWWFAFFGMLSYWRIIAPDQFLDTNFAFILTAIIFLAPIALAYSVHPPPEAAFIRRTD